MTQNFGILAIPPNASELTKHLVPRLMRTALEGAYDIHCENCERRQRALACFLVMCNFLAAVTDSDDIVDRLSEEAKAYIEQSREGLREIEAMAARGMTPDRLLNTAASDEAAAVRKEQAIMNDATESRRRILIKAVHHAAIELAVRRPTPDDDGRTLELYPPPKPNEKMVAVSSLAIFERVLLTIPNVTLEEVQDTIMQSLPHMGERWQ